MNEHNDDSSEKAVPYKQIVGLNYFSLLFLCSGIICCYLFTGTIASALACFALWFYLLPPLLCRITILFVGRPIGLVGAHSRTHTLWWWLLQLQLPFNRFPASEELLRSIPGLYAFWLNLWGAHVSPFAYWSPGVVVMERYHLHIGKGVILGTQSFLSGHVMKKQPDGTTLLLVDKIQLDEGSLVGAKANISPGCHIHSNQTVPFNAMLRPYTLFKDGRKTLMRSKSDFDNPEV